MSNNFEVIDGFKLPGEFNRFERWLQREVDAGCAVEVDVKNYYAGVNFKEKWFYFKEVDSVWRLVYPDGPFYGYWVRCEFKAKCAILFDFKLKI